MTEFTSSKLKLPYSNHSQEGKYPLLVMIQFFVVAVHLRSKYR
jgi:hypothetical protein